MEDLDSESLMLYAHSVLPSTLELLPPKLYRKLCGAPLLAPFLSNPEAEHASEKSYTSGSDAPPTSEDESEDQSEDEGGGGDKASSSSNAPSVPSRSLSGTKSLSKPKPKPKFSPTPSSSPTVVTPTVWQIAHTVYNEHQLKMVGDLDTGESACLEEEEDITHHFDPVHVKWGRFLEKENEVTYYEGVTLDGVEYVSGDYLIVVPGEDSLKERELNHHSDAAQSANKYAAHYWFCQVSYFYEEDNEKWAHCQWFSPGCKTMLQELAHPQSLYLLYECDDIPINSILKKCEVKTLVQEEKEPALGLHDPSSTVFHCSLVWDKENTDFTDLPFQKEVDYALSLLPPHKPCLSCGQEEKKRLHHQLSRVHRGFGLDGTSYHHHDFVYLPPEANSSENLLLRIGQIIAMSGIPTGKSLVTVQIFERFDQIDSEPDGPKPASGLAKDDKCLVQTFTTVHISPHEIVGLCFVKSLSDPSDIEEWVAVDDHFYCSLALVGTTVSSLSEELSQCPWCMEADAAMVRKRSELLLRHGPLIGLELFAGAGGLGTGMDLSGWVKTQYVVELGKAAAESYSYNHPGTNVYCQDVNSLLEFAVRRDEGHSLPYLPNGIGGLCTSLPKRGEVDFIFGGAPCQAFSGINHTRKADDIRSTLVCNMLSWVEHYQPTYFLLENVPGLLRFRLLAEQGENGSLIGGIKMGVVKFVQRTLIALGYQVRHKILEAAQYGAPQGRQRVIFWGSRRGNAIPDFPLPMHCFAAQIFKQPDYTELLPVTRAKNIDLCHHSVAPLPTVTVEDAIGDLPPFDWINPHVAIPQTPAHKLEVQDRTLAGIKQCSAVSSADVWAGFIDPVNYPYQPLNHYQKWIRSSPIGAHSHSQHSDKVLLHYTSLYTSEVVERTVNIPLEPKADHRSLPRALALNQTRTRDNHAFYGRLDGTGLFRTALTTNRPGSKNTYPLHPSQKRVLTQHKQIGNAVPVPLAMALGKSLGDALVKDWSRQERDGSPEA
ncbi:hypothetical protein ONZ45_g1036 [Pleurotus djamor]|nr:hypothetical protein ONZ45_g1036 [Pleurotus djamor]